MAEAVRVSVVSRDRAQIVDAVGDGSVVGTRGRVRAGSLKRGELAPRTSQEPMVDSSRVLVGTRDCTPNIDSARVSAIEVPRCGVSPRSVRKL